MQQINTNIKKIKGFEIEIFKYILKSVKPTNLHDVACGQGLYSLEAHKMGFEVIASDIRTHRVPLKEFKDKGIKFIKSAVGDLIFNEEIILLSGIFYHLDISEQLILLDKIQKSVCKKIILNTHFYHKSCFNDFPNLIIPTCYNDISGAIYIEGDNLINRPLAAFHNKYSFWHDIDSLQRIFKYYGFEYMAKINPERNKNRAFFILER
jgi:hypothetical protein